MRWMPTAMVGATFGAAWPMSWPRRRTSWRAPGWQADQPWGVEVRLPPRFDVGRADVAVRQASALWTAEGVQTIDGAPLPQFAEATLLLPAGAGGPAFLVGLNFQVILRYNNSTSYALAVGLLAQRLAGGPGVQAPWPRDLVALSRQQLTALQTALNQRGFDSGAPDGVMGPTTRRNPRLSTQRRIACRRLSDHGVAAALAGAVDGYGNRCHSS